MVQVAAQAEPSRVEILMYHSISHEPGPTSIAPEVFAGQLQALRRNGYACVSLPQLSDWAAGRRRLPERCFVLTFDDGFADFAERAFPLLEAQGYARGATVFVPTDKLGGCEDWEGKNMRPRPLMGWSEVRDLAAEGVEFGGHSRTHADLTRLSPAELEREVRGSQDALAEQLGAPARSFAPPYGHSNPRVLQEVARWAEVSVGTRFDHTRPGDALLDLPRLEMYYFRNLGIWNQYLKRRADAYLGLRKLARGVRRRLVERSTA